MTQGFVYAEMWWANGSEKQCTFCPPLFCQQGCSSLSPPCPTLPKHFRKQAELKEADILWHNTNREAGLTLMGAKDTAERQMLIATTSREGCLQISFCQVFYFLNSCCFEQEIRANTICHSHWEGKLKGCVETCWYDTHVCGRQGMWWVETLCRLWAWQENGKCETKAAEADHNQPGLQWWCATSSLAFISCLKVESVVDATQ